MHTQDATPEKQSVSSTKPPWLKRRAVTARDWQQMKSMLDKLALATVCEEAACPNLGECFRQQTATFLILGRTCTRHCRFCAVEHGEPQLVDPNEPQHVVEAVQQLGLRHVVITSVTRDDLADGGAAHFAACIQAVHSQTSAAVEVLVPDFQGHDAALRTILASRPEVFGHNLEVVPRLYAKIRPEAKYQRSLQVLERAKQLLPTAYTKSGLMVGLGELEQEVIDVMHDLRGVDCDFLTVGQYLRPSPQHCLVAEYVRPEAFEAYHETARALGFRGVLSGPFVRSSYCADSLLRNV